MTVIVIHHSAVNTLPSTELSYTYCTDVYISMAAGPYVTHRLCTYPRKSHSALYTRCTPWNDCHGNPSLGGEHSAINATFVHLLYGPVQHHGGGPGTSPTGNVHILGSPVVPCTLRVRFGTTLMAMHHWVVNTLPPTELLYTHCAEL